MRTLDGDKLIARTATKTPSPLPSPNAILSILAALVVTAAGEPRPPDTSEGRIDGSGKFSPANPVGGDEKRPVLRQPEADEALEKTTAIRKTGEHTYAIGKVSLDQPARTITIPAKINMREDAVEYALVAETGKVHETLCPTPVEPEHIHVAARLQLVAEEGPQREAVLAAARDRSLTGQVLEEPDHEHLEVDGRIDPRSTTRTRVLVGLSADPPHLLGELHLAKGLVELALEPPRLHGRQLLLLHPELFCFGDSASRCSNMLHSIQNFLLREGFVNRLPRIRSRNTST